MTSIVVTGALANKPRNGGEAWVRLSWVLGLRRLGCNVHFVEEIRPAACVNDAGLLCPVEDSVNVAFWRRVIHDFDLKGQATLVCVGSTHGLDYREILRLAETADLLVNISGHLSCGPLFERFRCKAYIDIDPGFTQFWHADPSMAFKLARHDFYFTIGENIGTTECAIPTGGIPWRPIRQPVVLEQWPVVQSTMHSRSKWVIGDRFTTIASWRGPFGPVQAADKTFGLKVHEFRKVLGLPQRVPHPFEIALDIHPADQKDRDALELHGWRIVDPRSVVGDPAAFREYVQGSAAEFSVAQGIYVETNSGWFSDRSVRYLASGKPVLLQDTGFGRTLPIGEGIVPFRTLDEAVAGADDIVRNYERHSRAARHLAETYFDSEKVLGRMLDEVGLA